MVGIQHWIIGGLRENGRLNIIQNHIPLHHRRLYVGVDKQANAEELLFKTSRAVIDFAESLQYFNGNFFIFLAPW